MSLTRLPYFVKGWSLLFRIHKSISYEICIPYFVAFYWNKHESHVCRKRHPSSESVQQKKLERTFTIYTVKYCSYNRRNQYPDVKKYFCWNKKKYRYKNPHFFREWFKKSSCYFFDM